MPEEHRIYLADRVRLEAFRRAIEAKVRPGAVVLDLGAGTGILGLMACRAGAGRVYAVDAGPVIGIALRAAEANGFGDRVVGVRGMSTRVELPEKADLVVADLVGGFGVEAGILEYFEDARARHLRPGAATVPEAITIEMAPVEAPELHSDVEFWAGRPGGFDFAEAREVAASTPAWRILRREQVLGDPAALRTLDLASDGPEPFAADLELPIRRGGVLHGLGGWFRARLAPGVEMTTSPFAAERIDRRNVFLPLGEAVPVREGDRVLVRMNYVPAQFLVAWRGSVVDGATGAVRARFERSNFRTMGLSSKEARAHRPDRRPRLDRWGEAWRDAVALCDGMRTSADIRAAILGRFPALFRSDVEAGVFVAEVLEAVAGSDPPGEA